MSTDDGRFDVVVARRVSEPVWWAGLGRALDRIVGGLPAHRDSAKGRKNANQARLFVLASGILVVTLWNSPWAPVGLIPCLAALVLPVSESRRRQLRASLRAKRHHSVISKTPGVLEVDERHVTLESGGERVRRIRRKSMSINLSDGALELRAGQKKVERIIVRDDEPIEDDLWVVGDLAAIARAVET